MKCQNLRLADGRRVEVLQVNRRGDGVDIAAQDAARKSQTEEDALAARRVDGMVYGVIRKRRREGARLDSIQRVRAVNAAEIDVLEVIGGGGGLRNHVRNIVSVSEAGAPEAAAELVAGES